MIAESPRILLILLVATTVLGAVMGYCIALLRTKNRASNAINSARVELGVQKSKAERDLEEAHRNMAVLQATLAKSSERASKSVQREEALEVHSQLQAQRISTLEAQLASYEDQQIRLQRDFASYKSNKSRELELAKNNRGSWSEADKLPTLSKRIENDDCAKMVTHSGQDVGSESANKDRMRSVRAGRDSDALSKPLSRELDIPALSESELPDSVEELEFELVDMDGTGAWPRG